HDRHGLLQPLQHVGVHDEPVDLAGRGAGVDELEADGAGHGVVLGWCPRRRPDAAGGSSRQYAENVAHTPYHVMATWLIEGSRSALAWPGEANHIASIPGNPAFQAEFWRRARPKK